jgi:uncharacterized protein YdhG (YjbR/CyaY superfamily)
MTPDEYIKGLSEERRPAMENLRKEIKSRLPEGFDEIIQYGMLSYVVPHSLYPAGYHCDAKQPLPFLALASPKSHIAIYHMGMYASPELYDWFINAYKEKTGKEPDMGKSCIRFKKTDGIPADLIGELASKMHPQDWIGVYEMAFRKGDAK